MQGRGHLHDRLLFPLHPLLQQFVEGIEGGYAGVDRGQAAAVEVAHVVESRGGKNPAHHEVAAEHADADRADVRGGDAEGLRHFVRQQAGRLVPLFEEAAGDEAAVDAGHQALAGGEPDHPEGAGNLLPAAHLDVVDAPLVAGMPVARHQDRGGAEVGPGVVPGGVAQHPPVAVADQQALALPFEGSRQPHEADTVLERGERQHREGQQRQGDQGHRRAQLAAPHVRNAEHEGDVRRPEPRYVRPVHLRHPGPVFRRGLVEAGAYHPHHQDRHGHDRKRQHDHQRMGEVEGRMHLGDDHPDQQHQRRQAEKLAADIRGGEEQTLAEEGGGNDQRQEEDHSLDHVVEGLEDLGIDARLEAQGLPRPGDVAVPTQLRGSLGGLVQQLPGALVKALETAAADRVFAELHEPLLVELPHVASRFLRQPGQWFLAQGVADAAGLLLASVPLAVEQHQALIQQPAEQEPQAVLLAPQGRPEQDSGRFFRVPAEQVPELPRLRAAEVHDGRAAVPQQRPRTYEGVDLTAPGLEKHDRADVDRPGRRGPEIAVGQRFPVVLGGALGEVGRRVDRPGPRVELEGGELLHGGGNPPEDGVAVSVGDCHALPVHPGLLLVVGVDYHQGAGHRTVGSLAAPGVLPHLDDEIPHPVLDDPARAARPDDSSGSLRIPTSIRFSSATWRSRLPVSTPRSRGWPPTAGCR